MKKIIIVLFLIIFYSLSLHAQVNFQHIFTLNKPSSTQNFEILQLIDYDNNGIDEVVAQYWDENILLMQIIISDQNGTVIDTISIDDWTCEEYNKFYLIKEDEVNYLLRAKIDWDPYYLHFLKLDCENLSVVDSIGIEPIGSPFYEVNLIDTYLRNGERVYLIGAMELSFMKEDSEENYLYKIIEDNDTLSYVGHFSDCGISNTHPNDSTLLSIGKHSYVTIGPSAATEYCYYYLQKIRKDAPYTQTQLHSTSGSVLWQYRTTTTYNHYPKNYDIITQNCQDDFSQVLQYRKRDTDNGNSVHFRAYETVNWQGLWSRDDSEIGLENITASTCIPVNEEDHYVMYFRGDKLEIRNRINGNIVHHQDSVLEVSEILRKSDGELLFFVEKQDGTGYDVYILDCPIFVSADETPAQNDIIIQQYPNPFRNSITILLNLTTEHTETTEVNIYNVRGQLVRELLPVASSPTHTIEVTWDGRDENGKAVSSGIYFYKLQSDDNKIIGKMLKIE